ncbi:uncharacterized protein KY384_008423 [Bacidia gigantensis]|uniref:uncharacterized protein n=1 Tax=Bacidia gigantensis TaxID=2732470 RepID=UPI001D040B26|nr:uncharacterized protein KY384_008423 [Bacidia gigantensis]KAG8526994.1 hypothetical protein KY384_008423 [Bacidia gigantensis]
MTAFLSRIRSGATPSSLSSGSAPSKKDSNALQLTPLERHLLDSGPIREDGSDKFWGLENFGNTCYANSILQCLYYSVPFRDSVISYPTQTSAESVISSPTGQQRLHTNTTSLPLNHPSLAYAKLMNRQTTPNASARNPAGPPATNKPEDKEHPDYKKKVAQTRGPTIALNYDNASAYGMSESLFTSLKDIFESLYIHQSRTGVVSPSRFLEILKRDNEMFRSSQHQDAHEFLNLLLNDVVEKVEIHSKSLAEHEGLNGHVEKSEFEIALAEAMPQGKSPAGGVHDLFEGTLTSETKCLTCENVSQRDEAFLDLSVDLEEHTSVTSCLRKFSEEEMLCERNKFHCDNCGGLQEAEKRMKIKRLPKILALHLKRFKFTDDFTRLQKLFHRVVYPYHLRVFNTTEDAEDPDRLYELYAVVVHIGGGPYHGHYVAIIKTQDKGWLLFDDEMVEPVDKSYVQNFFGDSRGQACAYVLFYQETTQEAVKREQEIEGRALLPKHVDPPKEHTGLGLKANGFLNSIHPVRSAASPASPDERVEPLDKVISEPSLSVIQPVQSSGDFTALPQITTSEGPTDELKSKKERQKEDKERKVAARQQAKEDEKADREKRKTFELKRREIHKRQESETKQAIAASKTSKVEEDKKLTTESGTDIANHSNPSVPVNGGLSRFKATGKSFRKPKFLGGNKDNHIDGPENIPFDSERTPKLVEKPPDKAKHRFSSLRKKTSNMML